MSAKLLSIIRARNTLGECATWDSRSQCLWWTDIQERRLLQLKYGRSEIREFPLPARLASFGLTEDEDILLCAFERSVALFSPSEGAVIRTVYELPAGTTGIRFNDGRTDRSGRFWSGTMSENRDNQADLLGELYCVTDGSTTSVLDRVGISNGLAWSPDGSRMYFADSANHVIYSFDYDAGVPRNRQVFARLSDDQYPDGATVDSGGCLWTAVWGAGSVVQYSPGGDVNQRIRLPVSQPSCVAFGGQAMDLLFVTTAREGLTPDALRTETSAGDLFVYETQTRGLREPEYSGNIAVTTNW